MVDKRPPKEDGIVTKVIEALEEGNLKYTIHALDQMKVRDVITSDVEEAIYNGRCEASKDSYDDDRGRWKYCIRGENEDADKDLRIVVTFTNPITLIITVIDKNK